MSKENSNRILWLTDIHFFIKYEKPGKGKAFIEDSSYINFRDTFYTKVRSSHNEAPFDYILISGDLVQQGTTIDYTCFWKNFLKGLLDIFLEEQFTKLRFSPPRVICIPGNHDVNWSYSEFLKKYIEKLDPAIDQIPDRVEYLKGSPDEFFNLFSDYKTFVTKTVMEESQGKYIPFFDLPGDQSLDAASYSGHRLFGHIIDHRKKMIFVLLNSAWYSLGDKFNISFAEHIMKDKDFAKSTDFFEKILKEKDFLSEYNSQITGIHLLELESLNKIFSEYKDYVCVTALHHPMNWLAWDQYYAYDKDNNSTANDFKILMGNTDLLLTGHEHVPRDIRQETVFKNTIHLRGGCFLFDKQHEKINLSNSWFSVLDIDAFKGTLTQTKFYFNHKKEIENWEKEPERLFNILVKKNDEYHLCDKRRERILDKLTYKPRKKYLKAYLEDKELIADGTDIKICKDTGIRECEIYEQGLGDDVALYFFTISPGFYSKTVHQSGFIEQFKMLLNRYKGKRITTRFIVLDLLTIVQAGEIYSQKLRQSALQTIAQTSDLLFDRFRHALFSTIKPQNAQKRPKKREQVFTLSDFMDIRCVNHVIPYYIFEKYWIKF